MANMSYCQFRNTKEDFQQCLDAIGNAESIKDFSSDEQRSAEALRDLAFDYVNWYDQLLEESDSEEDDE